MAQFVGNKAKGRISKRVFQENKACQIFRKTNISYPNTHTYVCWWEDETVDPYAQFWAEYVQREKQRHRIVLIYVALLSILFTFIASSITSSTLTCSYSNSKHIVVWWVGSGNSTVEPLLLFDLFDLLFQTWFGVGRVPRMEDMNVLCIDFFS